MHMKTDVFPPSPYVFLLRFLHFFAFLFAITYIFFFPQETPMDIVFICYCVLLIIQWVIFGDCILTILERRHYQNKVPNIYLHTIFGEAAREFIVFAIAVVAIYAIMVIHRQSWLPRTIRTSLIIISVPIALVVMYVQYKLYDGVVLYKPHIIAL